MYTVKYGMNEFESGSRDAKKHAVEVGQDIEVYDKKGTLVSRAKIDENGKAYSCYIGN